MTPSDQRDIPQPMVLCSAIKAQGKEDKGGLFVVTAFAFPRKRFAHLQEGAKHLPADGKELLVSLLAHRALLHSN